MSMKSIIVVIFLISFLFSFWRERIKRKILEKELLYLADKIVLKTSGEEDGLIMLATNNSAMKKMVLELNSSLTLLHQREQDYRIMKKNMLEVLTNISHDLRTPLTILKGYIDILQEKESRNTENQEIISRLKKKVDETIRTMNQFFSMARIESGDTILNPQNTNICKISGEILLEYYDLLKKIGFRVDIQIPERPIMVKLDEDAYRRIIKNFIDNAIKYGRKGGYLGILVREQSDFVSVEIEDHGEGIPEKEIAYIFDRRYSVTSGTSPKQKSSGLGLFISKQLAQKMNANIIVHSEPDRKTIFKLLIKVRKK